MTEENNRGAEQGDCGRRVTAGHVFPFFPKRPPAGLPPHKGHMVLPPCLSEIKNIILVWKQFLETTPKSYLPTQIRSLCLLIWNMLLAEEEGVPSLLSGAGPILWEEFNLERKWRISSDLRQGMVCDLFLLCPGRCDQCKPSCCSVLTGSSSALLPQLVRAGYGGTKRTGNCFWLQTRRASGHAS